MSVFKKAFLALLFSLTGILVFSISAFAVSSDTINSTLNNQDFTPLPLSEQSYSGVSSDGVYYLNIDATPNTFGFVGKFSDDTIFVYMYRFGSFNEAFWSSQLMFPLYLWKWGSNYQMDLISYAGDLSTSTVVASGYGNQGFRVLRQDGSSILGSSNSGNKSAYSSFTCLAEWNTAKSDNNFIVSLVPFSTIYDTSKDGYVTIWSNSLSSSGVTFPSLSSGSKTSLAIDPPAADIVYCFRGSYDDTIVTNAITSSNVASSIIGSAVGNLIPEYDENGNITNIITNNTYEFDITPFTESDGNQPDPWDNSAIDDYNSSNDDVQDSISDFKGQFAFSDVFGEDFDLTSFRGAMTFWKDRFDEVMDFNPVFPVVITTSLTLGLVAVILGRKLGVG